VIQERSRVLRQLSTRKKAAFYRRYVGHKVRVLFERREDSGLYTGFSDSYIKVGVRTTDEIANQLLQVRLLDVVAGVAVGVLE
jgi:threonylcarbamoyladenosine tRNA methylthiotransferase MtaB